MKVLLEGGANPSQADVMGAVPLEHFELRHLHDTSAEVREPVCCCCDAAWSIRRRKALLWPQDQRSASNRMVAFVPVWQATLVPRAFVSVDHSASRFPSCFGAIAGLRTALRGAVLRVSRCFRVGVAGGGD